MITYLYGASPLSEANYFVDELHPHEPVRSIRNSEYGYTNHSNVKVSYASMEQYLADIEQMIEEGKLSEEKEFYAPVRFRGGKRVADVAKMGVRYIELRNIDLNPYHHLGISKEQVQFLQLFLVFMLWAPEGSSVDEWVEEGTLYNNRVALEGPLDQTAMYEEGLMLFTQMKEMVQALQHEELLPTIDKLAERLNNPSQTIAAQLYTEAQSDSQKAVAVALGRKYDAESHERPYQLAGFREMELSTQIFLFDAIQKGIQVKVIDEADQFLRLQFENHVEYVKNANMTSKDSYIVPLIMENKTVTKKF